MDRSSWSFDFADEIRLVIWSFMTSACCDRRRGGLMSSMALAAVIGSCWLTETMNMFRRWMAGMVSKAGVSLTVLER